MLHYLSNGISNILSVFKDSKKVDSVQLDSFLENFKKILFESDVAFEAVEFLTENIKERVNSEKIKGKITADEFIAKNIYDALIELLTPVEHVFNNDFLVERLKETGTVLIAGLQGAGKTTTIGKLLFRFIKQYNKEYKKDITKDILVVSLDYYRPAARTQLEILCKKLNVNFCNTDHLKNPIDALNFALQEKRSKNYSFLFVDTAGRMHVDKDMMQELKDVYSLLKTSITLLVIDGMMGQYALKVAEEFNKTISFDAAVITKLDSNAKGGSALSFSYIVKKPIVYIGSGEKLDDLDVFKPQRIAKLLIGEGDLEGLLTSAQEKISQYESDLMEQALKKGELSLTSYMSIIKAIERMGPLKKIFGSMPKMLSSQINDDQFSSFERINRQLGIIYNSMTEKERKVPKIFNMSRIKRVANGSGLSVHEVQELLKQFDVMKDKFKMLSGLQGLF